MGVVDRSIASAAEIFAIISLSFILSAVLIVSCNAYAGPAEWLERCAPYELTVKDILKKEGLSTRYYFLMVAESRCTPDAKSSRGAIGFWQMLPATMRAHGCDDAKDLACQTRAAANYISSLEERFKTFEDVIAAWNQGGHNLITWGRSAQAKGLIYAVKSAESAWIGERQATVVIDDNGECIDWFWDDTPGERNPCDFAPPDASVQY